MHKKAFIIITLIPLIAYSMENNVKVEWKALSRQSINCLHEALMAFHIPIASIKLVRSKSKTTSYAHVLENKIEFAESDNKHSNKFTAFHEVGHLYDEQLKKEIKYRPYIMYGTYCGSAMITIVIALIGLKLSLRKFPQIVENVKLLLASSFGIGTISSLIGFKSAQESVRILASRCEHRANVFACEKLIEKKEYYPILSYMSYLKSCEYTNIKRTCPSHPLVIEEFQEIEKFLKQKNLSVKQAKDQHNEKLHISIEEIDKKLADITISLDEKTVRKNPCIII